MPMPFKTQMTVDQAAAKLYEIMGKDDNSKWVDRLKVVTDLDLVRASDELLFLDLFAIYFSIKFTRCDSWPEKGIYVFEKIYHMFVNWLGNYFEGKNAGTCEDAIKILDSRIRSYGMRIEEPDSVDPNKMLRSIGETFATYAFCYESHFGDDGHPREDKFMEFKNRLSQDYDDVTITVGGEAFNYRIKSLYPVFENILIV